MEPAAGRCLTLRHRRGMVTFIHGVKIGYPPLRIEFEDAELHRLYVDPDFRIPRMGNDLARQFRKKVGFLVAAVDERDLVAYRALRFKKLVGDREGQCSIRLNDQWRLILRLEADAEGRLLVLVEVVDYH